MMYQIDDSIPEYIYSDGFRLRQILTNIVGNAIKFTKKGEVHVDVRNLPSNEQDILNLEFRVRDTGIGIPAEMLPTLFTAFNQVDSSITRRYGGSGLGLVISERLVKLLHGNITVESVINEGSIFSFNIKCKKGSTTSHQSNNARQGAFINKKVLIVDDNDTNLSILRTQLSKVKMQVTAVKSGSEALTIFNNEKDFDLVVTDMQMPDMDGVRLSTIIKGIYPHVPIVLLSSVGDESKKDYPHLFTSVLTKPVRQQILYRVIELALSEQRISVALENKKVLPEHLAIEYPFNILVAEDNLMNQKLILKTLDKLGYAPELANDGLQVLEMMKNKKYDLILMDIQMPNLDGLETTRIIRKEYGNSPLILAMTANALTEDRLNCYKAGMNVYLPKPINLALLVSTLRNLHKIT